MLLPLAIAFGATFAGALLGMGGRGRSLPALRTFALVSALAVVLAQLLPETLAEAGLWALALFAAGALLPTAIEKLGAHLGREHGHRVGLELGYAALWIHKVADGIGLGTYAGEHHAGHHHGDILFALAAHTVPMVALVAMVYQKRDGTRWAVVRVTGLAIATAIGVAITAMVPEALFERVEPWVTAAVAGLLFHVVIHDWSPEREPRRSGERLVDLVAVAAGVGLVVFGGDAHHHAEGGPSVRAAVGAALWELALETAPALLIGLVIGAVLSAIGSGQLPMKWLRTGGALRQATRGAMLGAPLPICACGVLPLAQTLRRRGGGPALVVAFLIATPELGVETFALTGRLLGWPFAVVRLLAAIAVAMVGGLVAHRLTRPAEHEHHDHEHHHHEHHEHAHHDHAHHGHGHEHADAEPHANFPRRVLANFDELVHHIAPWTVVGLVAAAYVQAVLGDGSLAPMRLFGLDIVLVTLVAVPSYVCAASATPLAAVLLAKGMSPGAVLVGLLLGPATNVATIGFLRRSYGSRPGWLILAAIVGTTWALAFGVDASGLQLTPTQAAVDHEHGWLTMTCFVVVSLALTRSVWRVGLRAWLGTLAESFASASPTARAPVDPAE